MSHSEENLSIRIRQPSASDWDEICSSLCLSATEITALRQLVDRILADIQQHAAASETIKQGRSRRQQLKYIRRLLRLFRQLEKQLTDRDLNTDQLIRQLLASELGKLLSLRGVARLSDGQISLCVSDRVLTSRKAKKHGGAYEVIEDEIEHQCHTVAASIAPKLVLQLISALSAPFARFLEIQRANKGGAPSRLYRNYVIDALVPFYRDFLRKKPTPTPTGKFVLLCDLVINVIGLDGSGIDKAVARRLASAMH